MGTNQSFLFAAAIGTMVLGRACSRSISTTRARIPMLMLVSAPLHPHSQIFNAYGLCFSAGGIKGFAPLPKLENSKTGIDRRFLFAAAIIGVTS